MSKELVELNKRMKKQIIAGEDSEITKLREQVTAQAAVIEKMREAIEKIGEIASPYRDGVKFNYIADISQESLAIPTDSTQILAEVRKQERERVAQMILNGRFLHDESPAAQFAKEVAAAIRAME